jgi:hypothetical protein
MRCRRCQRAISGIGKPAVPPVIPAAIAFAGGIGGLWSLTLGQDPSNALPHWSPVGGWLLGLGSLALASVLGWIGLVRRRCPDCGCSQMLDAMEEESVLASERLGVEKAALAEARAEPRASNDKEMADRLAAREKEMRSTLEQELRSRLVRELEPQVEQRLRAEHERRSAEHERLLRSKLEEAPTPPPTTPLASIKEISAARFPATTRSTTPPPITVARAFASSVTPPAVRPVSARADGPAAISQAVVKTTTLAPSAVTKTAQPAAPQAKVDTAPLSLLSTPGKATIGPKASVVPAQAPPQQAASSAVAPSSDHPAPGKDSGSSGPGNAGK